MGQKEPVQPKTVLILGGGFVGIRTALDLAKVQKKLNLRVVLISAQPHFEYHATLYRVVTGRSPLQVCVPLRELFEDTDVEVIEDFVTGINTETHEVRGNAGFVYKYDYLVLGLGSETTYFGIPGLDKFAQGFKSITEALRLKRRIHEAVKAPVEGEKPLPVHIIVVGAGPSGTELAGELIGYTHELAKRHGMDPSLITVDLIEAAPRVVPMMGPDVSDKVLHRLHELGVNVFLNSVVTKETYENLYLKDMLFKTRIVIWTSGVTPNKFYAQIPGLQYDKRRKVMVDDHMQPQGMNDVFVGGDAASTQYSGMAQTALYDGQFIAQTIIAKESGKKLGYYSCPKPIYSIPVGTGWAATQIGEKKSYGTAGWKQRREADYDFYKSILPSKKAKIAYESELQFTESCPVCANLPVVPE
jgi:NADH dehydrogenase